MTLVVHLMLSLFSLSVAWVTVAVVVARFTNFFPVIFSDERVNRPVLLTAFVCLVVNTVLVLYLTVYLPKVKKLTDSSAWDVYCPNVIPSMTFVGIVCAILLVRATWPVWGFLAPLILGLEAMGALFALHFIPWY
jgi:hypothetical protein